MVVTSLTRNQVVRKGTWVRIPPAPPKIDKHCQGLVDFFLIHASLYPMRRFSEGNSEEAKCAAFGAQILFLGYCQGPAAFAMCEQRGLVVKLPRPLRREARNWGYN